MLLIPIVKAAQVSLYDYLPFPDADNTFVGLDNYTRALHDPGSGWAWSTRWSTCIVTVPGQIVLGLALALLLQARLPGRTLFRVLFYLPVVTSWVVVSLLFRYLFATDGGLVNWVLVDGLHLTGNRSAGSTRAGPLCSPVRTRHLEGHRLDRGDPAGRADRAYRPNCTRQPRSTAPATCAGSGT